MDTIPAGLEPSEEFNLVAKMVEIEDRVDMIAANFRHHADKEQDQYLDLRREFAGMRQQLAQIDEAMRGFFGSEYAPLARDVKGAKNLTKRLWRIAAAGLTALGLLVGIIQYVRSAPLDPPHEAVRDQ